MANKLTLLLTLKVVLACSYTAFGVEDLSVILAQFEKELLQASKKQKVPGFAVGIVQHDKLIYSKGFGVCKLQSKQPVTPHTIFQIASTSKPIAGTLMAMLHTQQVLSLDNPVVHYIPHFTLKAGKLKVKHLVTHTTGIPRQGFNQLIESKDGTRSVIIQQLKQTKLVGEPGSHFDYHNASFSLLEDVIAATTQKDFSYNLRTKLLAPLGMTRTTLSYAALQQENNKARPHIRNKQGKLIPCKEYSQGYYKVVSAGGINSCVADMCQFMIAQLGYKPDVLNQKALTLLHKPFIQATDFFIKFQETPKRFKNPYYGLGWRMVEYKKHRLILHGGLLKGFVSVLTLMPDQGIGIVILQNCESLFAWHMTMRFLDQVLGLLAKAVK